MEQLTVKLSKDEIEMAVQALQIQYSQYQFAQKYDEAEKVNVVVQKLMSAA